MDCCGQEHTLGPPRWIWSTTLTSLGAMLAGDVGPRLDNRRWSAETASAALEVLRKFISVDVHSQGGETGVTSKSPPNDKFANAMRAGSLCNCLPGRRSRRASPRQEVRRAFWPRYALQNRASFIGTISIELCHTVERIQVFGRQTFGNQEGHAL